MNILFVDDEPLGRDVLADHLENQLGHRVVQCDSAEQALEMFSREHFPLVLTDIRMPGMDGIELLTRIKEMPQGQGTDIILITAHGDMTTAIAALRAGAYDYLNKPIQLEELNAVVDRVVEHQALIRENYELTKHFKEKVKEATRETESKLEQLRHTCADIDGIGEIGIFSKAMEEVMTLARKMSKDKMIPVLIEGETGTGKEIVARMIHYGDKGRSCPFVAINCPAISPSLFESELFGYDGGAFTGAKKTGQIGKFELAQDGTVFLDEIGDMPREMQPKLLRVLQERNFFRVGGLRKINLEAQVICATNHDLDKLVKKGRFREDLFYRLNMCRIFIPPLRERKEEILPLARMFLSRYAGRRGRRFRSIDPGAERVLENYLWPGNVRELQNIIDMAVLLNDATELRQEHFSFRIGGSQRQPGTPVGHEAVDTFSIHLRKEGLSLDEIEAQALKKILALFNGNKTRVASYLGITRYSLRNKLKRLSRYAVEEKA